MKKLKVCVIYGGLSTEHDVSIVSAKSVIANLDKNKYDVFSVYIEKNGAWYDDGNSQIHNIYEYLKAFDVVFPVLHGLYGEDGSIQGLFELFGVKYVGNGILSSAVGMDKVYSKILFERVGLKQAKYIYIKKINDSYIFIDENFNESILTLEEIAKLVYDKLKFPVFVKPSNSGSSIGINKANNVDELMEYIVYASNFDKKILIEENIDGREIECSVLGNDNVITSKLGEIVPNDVFYSYDAKYNNTNSDLIIPAKLNKSLEIEIQDMAIKAYKALDCRGLARIDFFVTKKDIYINEINTMPGFTEISMYPKLLEASGIEYSDLLDTLIDLALNSR